MVEEQTIGPEIKALIGKEVVFPDCEEIEKGMIRRFATAIGDPNPLYHDEEFAKRSRYGGIIAPPTFLFEIFFSTRTELREDGTPVEFLTLPPPFDRSVRGGNEYEFLQPVRPGDRITCRWKVADIYEKEGKRGKLLFVIREATFTNHRGELLGRNRETLIFLPREGS